MALVNGRHSYCCLELPRNSLNLQLWQATSFSASLGSSLLPIIWLAEVGVMPPCRGLTVPFSGSGLLWQLRPSDVEVELLAHTRQVVSHDLEEETGMHTGWIQNGGLFIASNRQRLDEYKRLMSVGMRLGKSGHALCRGLRWVTGFPGGKVEGVPFGSSHGCCVLCGRCSEGEEAPAASACDNPLALATRACRSGFKPYHCSLLAGLPGWRGVTTLLIQDSWGVWGRGSADRALA